MVVRDGRQLAGYRKWILPNYAVFDEKRYFQSGSAPAVFEAGGVRFGLIICEDAWYPEPAAAAAGAGAEVLLVINGSPFHTRQRVARRDIVRARVLETSLPLIYLNMTGGQDELVFDGGSFAVGRDGTLVFQAPQFEDGLFTL
jgi:NAD+ synthase (glutamine-hydrolysing)